ncbi:PLP-dependent aminotransferase family protein [Elongatibacter sediminis]|uniref:PLP-dependent aminotransferase family protein n=1 Tax=Elongatibacter sediminis TaxID=3119006 RepID=A0AAW9RDS2_9GAMM
MNESLIYLDPDSKQSLQTQIRQKLVDAVLKGAYPPGTRLPSSRKMAEQLGVARNTVVLAYEQLIEEGYLVSRERSGIFVNESVRENRIGVHQAQTPDAEQVARWKSRIRTDVGERPEFDWPANWQQHPFPFIDGHFDASLYPTASWREASRMALGDRVVNEGTVTEGDADDPMLIDEIRSKMLPRRGITAQPDEILITLGEQNALFLLVQLLAGSGIQVAVEEPGNPRIRQLLRQSGAAVRPQPVDEQGMVIDDRLDRSQLVYVTPSHQVPTAVTMPNERREQLLKKAHERDQIIIEDDFEHERNYLGQPHPALRGMDRDNRVIYVSALPRVLAPGLRIGFMVAAPELIRAARRLRQLVVGRPSLVNQRTAAYFLSLGHYDSFMARLHQEMRVRWTALRDALNHYRPKSIVTTPNQGGTAFWVRAPDDIEVERLTRTAAKRGILIEPDTHYHANRDTSRNCFRMGVTSIPEKRIREGVERLRELMWELSKVEGTQLDPDDPHLLRGDELQSAMSGATLIYRTVYCDPCVIELRRNGSMAGRAGAANEDCDEGRWWCEGDLWHRQWQRWAYGEESAYHVTLDGQHIRWYNDSGRLVDEAILHRPEP